MRISERQFREGISEIIRSWFGGSIKKLESYFGAVVAPGLALAFGDFEIIALNGATL